MYRLIHSIASRDSLADQLAFFMGAALIAETLRQFHWFVLETAAFLETCFVLDSRGKGVARTLGFNRGIPGVGSGKTDLLAADGKSVVLAETSISGRPDGALGQTAARSLDMRGPPHSAQEARLRHNGAAGICLFRPVTPKRPFCAEVRWLFGGLDVSRRPAAPQPERTSRVLEA